jgi:hypothetical protein
MIKNMELKKQRAIDDILHYSEILEKNYKMLMKIDKTIDFTNKTKKLISLGNKHHKENNLHNNGINNNHNNNNKNLDKNQNNIKDLKKKDKIELIKKITEICKEISNLKLTIKGTKNKETNEIIYSYDKNRKLKINLTYKDTLDPKKFPWHMVKISNYTPAECFLAYKNVIPNEYIFAQHILRKTIKMKSLKGSFNNRKPYQQPLKQQTITNYINPLTDNSLVQMNSLTLQPIIDTNLYCYCQKQTLPGDYMICKILLSNINYYLLLFSLFL